MSGVRLMNLHENIEDVCIECIVRYGCLKLYEFVKQPGDVEFDELSCPLCLIIINDKIYRGIRTEDIQVKC